MAGYPFGVTEADLLSRTHPIFIVRPDGAIIYEKPRSPPSPRATPEERWIRFFPSLLTEGTWDDMLKRLVENGGLARRAGVAQDDLQRYRFVVCDHGTSIE